MNGKVDPALLIGLLDVSFDEIYVTDANGITLWVSKACERFYGIAAAELIGRSVRELERQGVFSPSLTVRVLKEGRKITAVQSTNSGRRLLVTSSPLLDSEGRLAYVISNSRDITELLMLAERLSEVEELLDHYSNEIQRLRTAIQNQASDELIATSPAVNRVMSVVSQVARVDTTVLITGETGVGKTVVARRIHRISARAKGPFVELNCAAIPETLLESEIFGYEKGAFTGARKDGKVGMVGLAEGGTLFLDEISELPVQLQSKLLQLIQEHSYYRIGDTQPRRANIRIIAATNQELQQMVREGRFRRDLYYRLNVVPIHIPPLRQRPEDIDPLLDHFLAVLNSRYGMHRTLAPETRRLLRDYGWPGNIRELENMVERLLITAAQDEIQPADLPTEVRAAGASRSEPDPGVVPVPGTTSDLTKYLQEVERAILVQARKEIPSTYKLARALGISQSSVVRKLKKYGLTS